jgi:hypothetical protein
MKIQYDFFIIIFERLGRMHENKKKNIFLMFRQKPGILIWDLYLYSIKIQTIIKQNSIKLYAEKSQTFKNIFNFFYWGGPHSF